MKFNKLCIALLFASGIASADQCVQQRFQINGSDLVVGDVVELSVGSQSVSFTTNSNTFLAEQWPQQLGLRVRNNLNSDVASVGDMSDLNYLNRYIPKTGSNSNYLDVFSGDAVSLKINGVEQSSALVAQQVPAVLEKSIDLPIWITGGSNNAFVYLTNLSDQPMQLKIDLFNEQGGVFANSGGYSGGFSGSPTQAGGTTLAAKATAYLHIRQSAFGFGNGKIAWSPNSCSSDLLVSMGQTLSQQTHIFHLNGGEPL